MKQTWVLVSNSQLAQIFLLKKNELSLIHKLEHKESKEKVSHLVSDHEGRARGVGNQQYPFNEGQDIIAHEREKFVTELFRFCKPHFDAHEFEKIIIFSPPKLLGDIRRIFQPILAHCESQEIHKEVSPHLTIHEKVSYISDVLELPLKIAR